MGSGGCEEKAGEIVGFIEWRLNNLPEYREWLRKMLKAWGALLNEANNERSLLPFASAALTHLAVGLVTTYTVEGVDLEEAVERAERDLCAVHRAAVELRRRALESGELLNIVKEAQEELAREAGMRVEPLPAASQEGGEQHGGRQG